MDARSATRRPLSRRALLTFVWVGAFVILGLVGLRLHSAEAVGVPVVAQAPTVAEISESAASVPVASDGEKHTAHGNLLQSWHLDLLAICMLAMLASMLLLVLFLRRPCQRPHLRRLRELAVEFPRAPDRTQPLLLLLSISRT